MMGYQENELDATLDNWAHTVYPDDRDWVLDKANDYVHGRIDPFEVEMRMHHKDGHEACILSIPCIFVRRDFEPIRLVGTHEDITEPIFH